MTPAPPAGGAFAHGLHRALLRAAVLDGDPARQAWAEWRAAADVERLDAASYRLLPQLYVNLVALGVEDPWLSRLAEIHGRHERENRERFQRAGEVLESLRAAGIPTLVLKGAALAVQAYATIGARPMSDVDVLVPREHARAAIAELGRAGLVPPLGPAERELGIDFSVPFRDPGGLGLDLHWYPIDQTFPGDDVWPAAVPLTLGGARTLAPGPADHLLVVCMHGLSWNPLPPIRWVADAALIVRAAGEGLDWRHVVERARGGQLTTTVGAALRHLSKAVDAPVPDGVLEELRATPTSRLERRAHHEALQAPPRVRKSVVLLYDRFRRLRAVGDPDVPRTFVSFLTRARGVEHPWQLPAHALAKRREHRRLRRTPSTILPSGRRVPLEP